jgi:hypothetical protein
MPGNETLSPSRQSWLRFGLSTVLILLAILAGLLAGYRAGYQRGYGTGQQQRLDEDYTPRVYPVSDLVLTVDGATGKLSADFDSLIEMITSTVSPESWETVGGPGSIESNLATLSIVVLQHGLTHAEIAALLEELRDRRRPIGNDPFPNPQSD